MMVAACSAWSRASCGSAIIRLTTHNRIRLNLTCPLIMRGSDAILVDTGIGNRLSAVERKIFDHAEGWLLDGLKALGMEPGDVTHVVLAHLHFDHCGGMVQRRNRARWKQLFRERGFSSSAARSRSPALPRNDRLRAAYRHMAIALSHSCIARSARRRYRIDTWTVSASNRRPHQRSSDRAGGASWRRQLRSSRGHRADAIAHERAVESGLRPRRNPHDGGQGGLSETCGRGGWWVSFAHDERVLAAQVNNDRGRLALGDMVDASSGWTGL